MHQITPAGLIYSKFSIIEPNDNKAKPKPVVAIVTFTIPAYPGICDQDQEFRSFDFTPEAAQDISCSPYLSSLMALNLVQVTILIP